MVIQAMAIVGIHRNLKHMHKTYYDEDYKMTNREKVLNPKADKASYCENCDRDVVLEGQRCSVCHMIAGWPRKRFKI
jgi:RNase P subunit RPR2